MWAVSVYSEVARLVLDLALELGVEGTYTPTPKPTVAEVPQPHQGGLPQGLGSSYLRIAGRQSALFQIQTECASSVPNNSTLNSEASLPRTRL